MDKVIRFSVSLPEKLLAELDKRVSSQGYASRSEYTRDLIRERIVRDDWNDDNSEVIGIFTMIYSLDQNELVEKLFDIQKNADIDITCNTHTYLDKENCLETIMLKGQANKIKDFAQKIGGLKGVKFSKLIEASVPAS